MLTVAFAIFVGLFGTNDCSSTDEIRNLRPKDVIYGQSGNVPVVHYVPHQDRLKSLQRYINQYTNNIPYTFNPVNKNKEYYAYRTNYNRNPTINLRSPYNVVKPAITALNTHPLDLYRNQQFPNRKHIDLPGTANDARRFFEPKSLNIVTKTPRMNPTKSKYLKHNKQKHNQLKIQLRNTDNFKNQNLKTSSPGTKKLTAQKRATSFPVSDSIIKTTLDDEQTYQRNYVNPVNIPTDVQSYNINSQAVPYENPEITPTNMQFNNLNYENSPPNLNSNIDLIMQTHPYWSNQELKTVVKEPDEKKQTVLNNSDTKIFSGELYPNGKSLNTITLPAAKASKRSSFEGIQNAKKPLKKVTIEIRSNNSKPKVKLNESNESQSSRRNTRSLDHEHHRKRTSKPKNDQDIEESQQTNQNPTLSPNQISTQKENSEKTNEVKSLDPNSTSQPVNDNFLIRSVDFVDTQLKGIINNTKGILHDITDNLQKRGIQFRNKISMVNNNSKNNQTQSKNLTLKNRLKHLANVSDDSNNDTNRNQRKHKSLINQAHISSLQRVNKTIHNINEGEILKTRFKNLSVDAYERMNRSNIRQKEPVQTKIDILKDNAELNNSSVNNNLPITITELNQNTTRTVETAPTHLENVSSNHIDNANKLQRKHKSLINQASTGKIDEHISSLQRINRTVHNINEGKILKARVKNLNVDAHERMNRSNARQKKPVQTKIENLKINSELNNSSLNNNFLTNTTELNQTTVTETVETAPTQLVSPPATITTAEEKNVNKTTADLNSNKTVESENGFKETNT